MQNKEFRGIWTSDVYVPSGENMLVIDARGGVRSNDRSRLISIL